MAHGMNGMEVRPSSSLVPGGSSAADLMGTEDKMLQFFSQGRNRLPNAKRLEDLLKCSGLQKDSQDQL